MKQVLFVVRQVRAAWTVDRDGLPGGACENRHQLVYREGCIMGPDGVQGFAQARDGILADAVISDPSANGAEEHGFGEVQCVHAGGVSGRGGLESRPTA